MPGTTQLVSPLHIKEELLEIDLDTLLSAIEKQGGKLLFCLLEITEKGDFLIEILRRDGTLTRVIVTLREF